MNALRVLIAAAAGGAIAGLIAWALHQPGLNRRTTTWVCTRCYAGFSDELAAQQHIATAHPDS